MAPPLYLVDLTVYDPAIGSERVLRYGTAGFVTEPSDTPSNAYYAPRVRQPARMARSLFREGSTFGRAQEAFGELLLLNGDGALDALRDYAFDGRELVVRQGVAGAALTSFTTVLVATMERAQVTSDMVRVTVRDRALELAVPYQATKYAGDNDLPDGLEGVAGDLKGKPKPRCVGVVKNVPAPCVNTGKLLYQVNDGPVSGIDAVYDKGILLTARGQFTARTGGFTGDVYAVASGNGQLLAVGASDAVATSPDGTTWTQQATGHGSATWRGVAYGAGLWVIVGHSGVLYTSPDGITWTSRTSGFGASNIYGVVYGGGRFVIVGGAGKHATSVDGIAWTLGTSLGGAVIITCVTYGGTLYVLGDDTGVIYTSPDGATWTSRTSAGGDSIKGITYARGTYVAVGGNGVGGNARIATSVDGLVWYDRSNPFGTTQLWCVGWGPGEFLVGGTGKIGLSTDGLTWSEFTNPHGASIVYDVVRSEEGDGVTVLVGASNKVSSTEFAPDYYADADELLDDGNIPAPGNVAICLNEGLIRLGSPPAGLITVDATEGAAAADRTAGQVFGRVLADPLGGSLVPFSDEDIAALDTAIDAEVGFWTDQEITRAVVVDLLARSAGAWWGARNDGMLRIAQFTAPSGSPVLSLTEDQVLGLERVQPNDAGRGIPCYRTILRYARNYVTQDTDLAAGVTDARRAELAAEWREAKAEDLTVQLAHPLAPEIVEESLLADATEALAEATRRQALRGTERDVFKCAVALDEDTAALELGDVIQLTHSRFGLSAGVSMRVLGLDPDPAQRRLALTLWT